MNHIQIFVTEDDHSISVLDVESDLQVKESKSEYEISHDKITSK